jgi:SagB-type dehydrogenase family enzyme
VIRRARSLIIHYQGDDLVALNYVTKKSCELKPIALALLSALENWQPIAQFTDPFRAAASHEIDRLLLASVLVERGTPDGKRDENFESQFLWGSPAAYYHFSIRNTEYMSPVEFSGWMNQYAATTPPVPLYSDHKHSIKRISLPAAENELDIMTVMRRRRSYRGFSDEPIALAELGDCLFAGLGITGFVAGSFDEGFLPLSMTPSGGGRNPYEAYVYVRNVAGLQRGTYHYSASDHSLALVNDSYLPKPGAVLAGQPWFDNLAALILLVANFERTMWKYPHPTGYRVVVLEAGHIAQNIILAATAYGLASTPTCALSDAETESLTECTSITRTTMYSIALGHKSSVPTAVDPIQIIPNTPISANKNEC